ncbi:MAG TPA: monofunctional biosynthetic peptidoglycan transglycosylase [Rhodobacteraceae bacterium]|jgi:monofunctional biosynthetic peptidoglycan transglycosylase|nr:monofunctional biosynthetic peptidoglycan transglycosylase [Paracoccaceae bacterium]
MAKINTPRKKKAPARRAATGPALPLRARVKLWLVRGIGGIGAGLLLWIIAYGFLNPPITPYMIGERRILGDIEREWVPTERISPMLLRSVVAAEDANFCSHWGFDVAAIRSAIEQGADRGASTITQQVVKNAFLWHGRSWLRKALEAGMTPVVELFWSKRRILEVYVNIAEFDEGIFGVEAAARHHFGVGADEVNDVQAARLAMVLPAPKLRAASAPTSAERRRTAAIIDGANTIARDGRAACFEG